MALSLVRWLLEHQPPRHIVTISFVAGRVDLSSGDDVISFFSDAEYRDALETLFAAAHAYERKGKG